MRGRSRTAERPHERRSAVRAELARNAEKKEKTHRIIPANGESPRARRSAEVADIRRPVMS